MGEMSKEKRQSERIRRFLGRVTGVLVGLVVGVLATQLFTHSGSYDADLYEAALVNVLLVVSLNLIFGYAGLLSVGQAAVAGVGAYAAGIFAIHFGVPFLVALIIAMGAAGIVGLLLTPMGKLALHYFAMATLAAGLILVALFENLGITGGFNGLILPSASIAGASLSDPVVMGWLLLALVVIELSFMALITRGRGGRNFRAIRDDEVAAASVGIRVGAVRREAIVLGCVWAGAAGCVGAYLNGVVSPASYGLLPSVTLVLAVVIGGAGSMAGAVVAGLAIPALNQLLNGWPSVSPMLYGGFIIVVLMLFRGGLGEVFSAVRIRFSVWVSTRLLRGSRPDEVAVRAAEPVLDDKGLVDEALEALGQQGEGVQLEPLLEPARALVVTGGRRETLDAERLSDSGALALEQGAAVLVCDGIEVQFGGVSALGGVSLKLMEGRIHGMIGPNGAGKTTLFNVISGVQTQSKGTVRYFNKPIDGYSASERARAGIVRTYQLGRLFLSMTVEDNILAATPPHYRMTAMRSLIPSEKWRKVESESLHLATRAMATVGIADWGRRPVGKLSYGDRRMVELARAIAAGPQLLMLDEPAAGLTAIGRSRIQNVLQRLRDEEGMTILVVEHDLRLIRDLCDWVTCLSQGEIIADGVYEDVTAHAEVRAAYIGGRARI